MKPIAPHPEAKREVREAMTFYRDRQPGLEQRFRSQVEEAVTRIRRNPKQFPRVSGTEFRKCIVNVFPYNVYFIEFDDYVWIAAIVHQRRRPGYWLDRSPED